jgi:tRNA threonylcarbamoyladenosine biosynthesis protein TsaE
MVQAGSEPHGPWVLDQARLEAWGKRIGREAERPLILALSGQLGVGKSVLARAVARGAGVTGAMPSPTFNLMFRYETDTATVVHVDLYRLNDPDDVWELGWRDLAGSPREIVIIEWPEQAEALLPEPRWHITLASPTPGARVREVRLESAGPAPSLPRPE